MIYLDTSVVLAQLFSEDRLPRASLWRETLVSSRLLQYETWVRLHARRLTRTHADAARALIGRIALIELVPPVLAGALEPFPMAIRTLDALHLASMEFLVRQGQTIELASYDDRLNAVAKRAGIALLDLS